MAREAEHLTEAQPPSPEPPSSPHCFQQTCSSHDLAGAANMPGARATRNGNHKGKTNKDNYSGPSGELRKRPHLTATETAAAAPFCATPQPIARGEDTPQPQPSPPAHNAPRRSPKQRARATPHDTGRTRACDMSAPRPSHGQDNQYFERRHRSEPSFCRFAGCGVSLNLKPRPTQRYSALPHNPRAHPVWIHACEGHGECADTSSPRRHR